MLSGMHATNAHDESVYNLIPRAQVSVTKTNRYESKYQPNVRQTFQEGKHEHRTMGYAEESLPNPQHFLKKQPSSSQDTTAKDTLLTKDLQPRKPPVPRVRDAPKMGARTEKNFIQSNALDVVMTVPKKAERKLVDDRFGDKFSLDPSGLTPKYLLKKDFGEVPVYLKTRRENVEKVREDYQSYISDARRRGAMREMSDAERETIVDGLKKHWADVHREFQTLSVIIDTIPKRMRKERLEERMKLLEKDIDLLDKHQVIYIAD